MKEVSKGLWVGSLDDLKKVNDKQFFIVHATKSVFDKAEGDVIYQKRNQLYINWVDSKDKKYFDYNGDGVKVLIQVLDFIDKGLQEGYGIFIHCNEGKSRSASIAMVYMAKRLKTINNKDHVFAERDFTNIYQDYFAGQGISDFLFENWFKIK